MTNPAPKKPSNIARPSSEGVAILKDRALIEVRNSIIPPNGDASDDRTVDSAESADPRVQAATVCFGPTLHHVQVGNVPTESTILSHSERNHPTSNYLTLQRQRRCEQPSMCRSNEVTPEVLGKPRRSECSQTLSLTAKAVYAEAVRRSRSIFDLSLFLFRSNRNYGNIKRPRRCRGRRLF